MKQEHEIHHNLKNSEINIQLGGSNNENENVNDNILQSGAGNQENTRYIKSLFAVWVSCCSILLYRL